MVGSAGVEALVRITEQAINTDKNIFNIGNNARGAIMGYFQTSGDIIKYTFSGRLATALTKFFEFRLDNTDSPQEDIIVTKDLTPQTGTNEYKGYNVQVTTAGRVSTGKMWYFVGEQDGTVKVTIPVDGIPADPTDLTTKAYVDALGAKIPNTLFVDATNGDDNTAERENPSKPYQTLKVANDAATANDTIRVLAGAYTVADTEVLDGAVTWDFDARSCSYF